MHAAVREPYFVPETLKADVLFANMKKQKQPMAVVLDEYGGVTGIVTVHDLVERLVGEFDLDGEATSKNKIQTCTECSILGRTLRFAL